MQLTSNLREEMGLCWKQFWFSNRECIFDTSRYTVSCLLNRRLIATIVKQNCWHTLTYMALLSLTKKYPQW